MFKIKKKTTDSKVAIAIPHMGMVSFNFALSLRQLIMPVKCTVIHTEGLPWDMARNALVGQACRAGASHIFFLDSDMVVPSDALIKLLSRNLPVVGGNYTYGDWDSGAVISLARNRLPDGMLEAIPLDDLKEGIYSRPNMVVGSGCMLIEMNVFEKLEKPYFKVVCDIESGTLCEPEDFNFCRRCGEAGIQVALDCDVRCHHIKQGAFTCDGGFGQIMQNRPISPDVATALRAIENEKIAKQ